MTQQGITRLFTTWYPEEDIKRRQEFEDCLRRNLENPCIDEVCVFAEGQNFALVRSRKLTVRCVQVRPNYSRFFSWINEIAGEDDVSIISNTDIWFDRSIGFLKRVLRNGECYALARWEDGRVFLRNDSQDTWIFRGSIKEIFGDFPLGVVRCDNRLLYELQKAGYHVRNPALSIRSHHLHAGLRADYGATEEHHVQPPYRYLWPHNLGSIGWTVYQNLRYRDSSILWQIDRNVIKNSLPGRCIRKIRDYIRLSKVSA